MAAKSQRRSIKEIQDDIRKSAAPIAASLRAIRREIDREQGSGQAPAAALKAVSFLQKNMPLLLAASGLARFVNSSRRLLRDRLQSGERK